MEDTYDCDSDSDYEYDYDGNNDDKYWGKEIITIEFPTSTPTGDLQLRVEYAKGLFAFANFLDSEGRIYNKTYDYYVSARMEPSDDLDFLLGRCVGLVECIHRKCVMCDDDLACKVSKPSVCTKETCLYQWTELGLGFSVEEHIIHKRGLFLFFLDLYRHALPNQRGIYFEKPPTEGSLEELDGMGMEKLEEYAKGGILREMVGNRNYSFLQWLINGNRNHIELDTTGPRVGGIVQRYTTKNLSPEKELVFQQNKLIHGTILLYHGSRYECWHNILRNGLKVMSGTKYMKNGAAFGSGIYLSDSFDYSYNYSTPSKNGTKIIAICEVINRYTKNTHYIIDKEEDIKVLYILVCNNKPKKDQVNLLTK